MRVRTPPSHGWLVALAGAVFAASALAGCASEAPAEPGDLRFTAAWQPWNDDPLPHLILYLSNVGESPLSVGPGGQEVTVHGPAGAVPIFWGETQFARTLQGGQSVVVGLHPRLSEENLFGMSIDHAWGQPSPAPVGSYVVCVGADCVQALLTE